MVSASRPDETIETQIKLLRLEHVGWDAFLGAVAACADAYGTRIPIVIDGLNEALKGGGLSPIRKNHLAAACAGIKKRTDSVVLVTTCRGSYERTIRNGTAPAARLELDAATNYDVREAVERYFKEYKIVVDPDVRSARALSTSDYLRLFCEAHNPAKEVPREVSLGAETLFNVFDKYLSECDIRAREKLRRLAGVPLVVPALEKLGGRGRRLDDCAQWRRRPVRLTGSRSPRLMRIPRSPSSSSKRMSSSCGTGKGQGNARVSRTISWVATASRGT